MLVGVVLDVVRVVACAVEFVGLLAEVTDDYRRSHAVFMLVDGLPGGLDNGFVAPHRVGAPSVVPSGVVEGDVLLPTNIQCVFLSSSQVPSFLKLIGFDVFLDDSDFVIPHDAHSCTGVPLRFIAGPT